MTASYQSQQVELSAVKDVAKLTLRFSDAMLDLDQPVKVMQGGSELFSGKLERTILVLQRTLEERGDPALIFASEVSVEPN